MDEPVTTVEIVSDLDRLEAMQEVAIATGVAIEVIPPNPSDVTESDVKAAGDTYAHVAERIKQQNPEATEADPERWRSDAELTVRNGGFVVKIISADGGDLKNFWQTLIFQLGSGEETL